MKQITKRHSNFITNEIHVEKELKKESNLVWLIVPVLFVGWIVYVMVAG